MHINILKKNEEDILEIKYIYIYLSLYALKVLLINIDFTQLYLANI